MKSSGPFASLSLDLDNQWSYMKTHGNPEWKKLPSYLDIVVPRFLETLDRYGCKITVFVVGQDAALPQHHHLLQSIVREGHEIGNHSFHHEPWVHRYSEDRVEREIAKAEEAIINATGVRPVGYRGPGYSLSEAVLRTLVSRGYIYDASTLPTFIGPLARAYYFMSAKLTPDQREERGLLFGSLRDGLRPLRHYSWIVGNKRLLEIPVTTMPGLRMPIHFSYVLYLALFSPTLAIAYFRTALLACRMTGVAPSLLLHPLDFLGRNEAPPLDFFPAMRMSAAEKLRILNRALGAVVGSFEVVRMDEHAARARMASDRRVLELRWQSR